MSKINILIVEDESIVALDLSAGLEKDGYNVVGIADNAGEARQLFTEHKVDILLIAMGTPKQEKWIDRYIRPEHARLVISVGALFDFMAGEFSRAPETARSMRVEWLHRVRQEPKRLWKRYFIGGPIFALRTIVFSVIERLQAIWVAHRERRELPDN